ncbi:NADH-quinone oxidoreductase subunit NuoN [Candidatus Curculioniphilus buchneri]|uniref:NADH-quinone oxidoreductase subunit NuoN n=1 Tax=Candidatus Curculioniphilus buchneri TaxID=690594 RepID=UPI00376EB6AC
MTITFQQLVALLPLLIIGLTAIIVMICIIWRRNHLVSAILTYIGLSLALASLLLVMQHGSTDVTTLIRVDNFSIFYIGLILFSSLSTGILSYIWLTHYPGNCDEFYLMLLIATIGGMLLTSSNHLATLFLGIELMSLPIFGMIGYISHNNYYLESSIKYSLLSAIATSFLLFGIALIYANTGQLSFIAISQASNNIFPTLLLLLTGFGMLIIAFGFKLSLVPFHLWTPDVYQGAPVAAVAFLATVGKISIFSTVVRLFLYFPIINTEAIQLILTMMSLSSMLLGNLMALNQNNIKRILGYSSISHFGYLLIGIIALQMHTLALETIGVYLTGYLVSNLGIFSIISLMSQCHSEIDVNCFRFYRGLFWRKPLLSVILTVMIFSLAGIPMTIGFIGKFYIIMLGVKSHLILLTSTVIISSAIGLFYYLRIIVNLYLLPSESWQCNIPSNWAVTTGGIIVIISLLLVLFLGVYPQPLITLIQLSKPTLW